MKELLIFAGTTEGRTLSEYLSDLKVRHTICVATEYGEIVLEANSMATVHQGRMNREEIIDFLNNGSFSAVVDATHPYAEAVTQNVKAAANERKLPYFRLLREDNLQTTDCDKVHYFGTNAACAEALEHTEGNILLTTGSKELSTYCNLQEVKRRLYVRVLPSAESIALCNKQGICGKQIIAMQGPFTTEMNEALIKQYGISYLVTKESGQAGGFPEKLDAAKRTGTSVFVIGRPKEENGYSFEELCSALEKFYGRNFPKRNRLDITLAGIGMGAENCMTKETACAINEADILLGAQRLIAPYHASETYPFYRADQIIPYLKGIHGKKIVVLFSGDSGFYSGCQSLYNALEKEIRGNCLDASIRILPGISAVSYLAACIGESYQDTAIYSMHGKELCNLIHRIKNHRKTFLLMSGVQDLNLLGTLLIDAELLECEVVVGYQLSYPEQQIQTLTPQECRERKNKGLYTCFIQNPNAIDKKLTHGIADASFIRTKVPMTKEEVREVSICKLRLHDKAVVYDIGSGTGSVAVEIAALSNNIQVYAIEQKKEAVSLITQNIEQFCLQNITVVETKAPNGFANLPTATHAFIGGSGGNLKEILVMLQQKNPKMRVVINAISLETICEMKEILSAFVLKEEEIVQIQANRAKRTGSYHIMQAENPVWICSFTFSDGQDELQKGQKGHFHEY